jgi:CMP-N-acetylneuraminic acid synthetase
MTTTTCLLTARAGSSFKNKCQQPILGLSCLERAILSINQSNIFDSLYVSTDCSSIADQCVASGFVHIVRPDDLGSDSAMHVDVINHAISKMPQQPTYLCVVLPNNPFITAKLLTRAFSLLQNDQSVTSVIPVYQDNDHHPLRSKVLGSDGLMHSYGTFHGLESNSAISSNRQSLQASFFPSHNFWFIRVRLSDSTNAEPKKLIEDGDPPWAFFGSHTLPLIMNVSHDIHSPIDIPICEGLLPMFTDD